MSAAAVIPPPAVTPQPASTQVPFYTRHTLGAIEAARDRRLQARDRAVHRYTTTRTPLRLAPSDGALDRWDDEGGHLT